MSTPVALHTGRAEVYVFATRRSHLIHLLPCTVDANGAVSFNSPLEFVSAVQVFAGWHQDAHAQPGQCKAFLRKVLWRWDVVATGRAACISGALSEVPDEICSLLP
eukprot:9069471-Alexandrium_andersonii.AAC.1